MTGKGFSPARLLSNGITAFLVVCAALITAALVKREFFADQRAASADAVTLPRWQTLVSAGHRMGDAAAAATIVEFSDFQCPSCAAAETDLKKIREKYPHEVAVIYRHFPLDRVHPAARRAAIASECAAEQGRFEQFHDALFQRQDSIGRMPWEAFARLAGIPSLPRFSDCLASGRWEARVSRDLVTADSLQLQGTPTLLVDGRMFGGSPGFPALDQEVRQALTGSRISVR
jgi:protein-disulfide isomerase